MMRWFENVLVVLGAVLEGYFVAEILGSLNGSGIKLPLTQLFLSLGLQAFYGTVLLASSFIVLLVIYFYWLIKYKPGIISVLKKEEKIEGIKPQESILERFKVKKEIQVQKVVPAGAEAYNFVNIVQLDRELPDVFAGIVKDEQTGGYKYIVIEPSLSEKDKQNYKEIRKLLIDELDINLWEVKSKKLAQKYLAEKVKKIVKRYGYNIPKPTLVKLQYYFNRDFIGYGKIEPLLHDYLIEDISCDGPGIPIYIWHREYESIPTNIVFENDEELNTFVSKLAYISGKHISLANPIVDASLPDGSRIQMSYGREVTQKGSTFTIRKFKPDPLTIVDLIKYNTMSSELAAYLWYLVEKRLSILVAGGTASGKTTTLNALSMCIVPGQKIVSVEDTPELNLPHENWVQSVARMVGATGEITLFDLLRAALRQRPDIIIVGEVRGEEAFTLFQAIASVSGDTRVMIRENGKARIEKIAKIVDRYYMGNDERIPICVDSLEVLSFDKFGNVYFRPVKYVLRHRASRIFTIKYAGGEIKATASHSVFVIDENFKVVEKPVCRLNDEDVLVSFNGSRIRNTFVDYMHVRSGSGTESLILLKSDGIMDNDYPVLKNWFSLIQGNNRYPNLLPTRPLLKLKELLGSSVDIPERKLVERKEFGTLLSNLLLKRKRKLGIIETRLIRNALALYESNLTGFEILSIEEGDYNDYVYDLSVPETEAFFGGDYPIALHNTGHGGMGTVHADSVETVITRLTSEPMKIPKSLLGSTLDCIVMQLKVRLGERSVRRVVNVTEVVGHDPRNDQIILNDVYRWDPVNDKFVFSGRSRLFEKITQRYGTTLEQIRKDIEYRKTFLDWLVAKNIRSQKEVSQRVRQFYADPESIVGIARLELQGKT